MFEKDLIQLNKKSSVLAGWILNSSSDSTIESFIELYKSNRDEARLVFLKDYRKAILNVCKMPPFDAKITCYFIFSYLLIFNPGNSTRKNNSFLHRINIPKNFRDYYFNFNQRDISYLRKTTKGYEIIKCTKSEYTNTETIKVLENVGYIADLIYIFYFIQEKCRMRELVIYNDVAKIPTQQQIQICDLIAIDIDKQICKYENLWESLSFFIENLPELYDKPNIHTSTNEHKSSYLWQIRYMEKNDYTRLPQYQSKGKTQNNNDAKTKQKDVELKSDLMKEREIMTTLSQAMLNHFKEGPYYEEFLLNWLDGDEDEYEDFEINTDLHDEFLEHFSGYIFTALKKIKHHMKKRDIRLLQYNDFWGVAFQGRKSAWNYISVGERIYQIDSDNYLNEFKRIIEN